MKNIVNPTTAFTQPESLVDVNHAEVDVANDVVQIMDISAHEIVDANNLMALLQHVVGKGGTDKPGDSCN
jgi:hypothetical protein